MPASIRPPPELLPAIRPDRDRGLTLRLGDEGRFGIDAAWLAPVRDPADRTPIAPEREDENAVAFAAPPPGDWLFGIELVFARERGEVETFFRLLPEEGD